MLPFSISNYDLPPRDQTANKWNKDRARELRTSEYVAALAEVKQKKNRKKPSKLKKELARSMEFKENTRKEAWRMHCAESTKQWDEMKGVSQENGVRSKER
ncbi:unnamed protein product [Allacma fusca]|uniref:Uncharacterized protein n=1 Tax=Allacma fusca TaxID=39272 RepID=A0A8J2JKC9_9HEXA|nr:unnamed protein product [Allacma fusca]